jgi:glutamate-1-semialdehyde 2,1-aminomutase
VVAAVTRQLEGGTHYGFVHELEIELAEMILRAIPGADMVRYTNSGTEAAMYAIGLARAFTGRSRIGKIEGGWHGGYDALRAAVRVPFDERDAGLDRAAADSVVALPFNDLTRARDAISSGDLACVIVEPMLGAGGFLPAQPGYLAGLKRLCHEHGTLLICDEVITGFRYRMGTLQELHGVSADITLLGKVIGGGFPIGALCGPREIFQRFDHRRFPSTRERAFQGGTFAANPISLAAGIATLTALQDGDTYRHLERLAATARPGLERAFAAAGVEALVTGVQSTLCVHFRREEPTNARDAADANSEMARRYYDWMLASRIAYLTPTVAHFFLNAAHTEQDIEELLVTTADFARHGSS